MKANLYKINCLTNMHVGSGDVNYNIIDNEVEKDFTGYPVIHASGIKGALRDMYKNNKGEDAAKALFGDSGSNGDSSNAGKYKFFDARFLARPLRVGKNEVVSFVPVTTVGAINDLLKTASAFGCNTFDADALPAISFNGKDFLVSNADIKNIEGSDSVGSLDSAVVDLLKPVLGDNFAIAEGNLDGYPLPVIARNKLDNGTSVNLWYEEYVPHHSAFWFIILAENNEDPAAELGFDGIIQIGGNASVGCGYTAIEKFRSED